MAVRANQRQHPLDLKCRLGFTISVEGPDRRKSLTKRTSWNATQVAEWKRQLLERAADVFDGAGNKAKSEPDLKVPHAKIKFQAPERPLFCG